MKVQAESENQARVGNGRELNETELSSVVGGSVAGSGGFSLWFGPMDAYRPKPPTALEQAKSIGSCHK